MHSISHLSLASGLFLSLFWTAPKSSVIAHHDKGYHSMLSGIALLVEAQLSVRVIHDRKHDEAATDSLTWLQCVMVLQLTIMSTLDKYLEYHTSSIK
eukprot:3541078-Pyramimonas_sp.AAC.1